MKFTEIERLWRSPHNRPTADEMEIHKMKFLTDLRRRRRGEALFLALIFVLMSFFTGKLAWHWYRPDPSLDPLNLNREWGVVPFFALPWVGWSWMVWRHLRHRREHRAAQASIHQTLNALLDENRAQRTRLRVVAVLLVLSAALLPLIVLQLQSVGKAGRELVIPAYVIYPLYVVGTVGWAFVHDRRKLAPRQRELTELLATYRSEDGE